MNHIHGAYRYDDPATQDKLLKVLKSVEGLKDQMQVGHPTRSLTCSYSTSSGREAVADMGMGAR